MKSVTIGKCEWQVLDEGSGETILFVHGFPLDHRMWRSQYESFPRDFRVIVPDLPGFGGSGKVEGTLSMAAVADDLVELLDRLEIDHSVTFCGLSMGGYVGWQFWQRHPQRLARLIQCDTRAIADTIEIARGRQLMAANIVNEGAAGVAKVAEGLIPKLFAPDILSASDSIVDATREVIHSTDATTIAAAQLGMAEREDFVDRLPSIDCPSLLVCGEHDVISPPDEMREIAAMIPAAKFVKLPKAGHMSPLETPGLFNDAVMAFLKESKTN